VRFAGKTVGTEDFGYTQRLLMKVVERISRGEAGLEKLK
jgi:hypothetical protein